MSATHREKVAVSNLLGGVGLEELGSWRAGDGDGCHGASRYEADMERQRQLERRGWEFFRVRESVLYLDRESALQGVWRILEEKGILPRGDAAQVDADPPPVDRGVAYPASQSDRISW